MSDTPLNIANLRRDYTLNGLLEQDVLPNALHQFQHWFTEALQSDVLEPNGMVLSTLDKEGAPNARVVLLKEVDQKGFVFYTNYQSHKGEELAYNAQAALTFWWGELERQIRVRGYVEQVSVAESDAYFAVRPRGSQIGAWVSAQSKVITNRKVLEQKLTHYENQFAQQIVPRPPHWGGYRVVAQSIEFWQGRSNRLHDRLRYQLSAEGQWSIERLSP